MNKCCSHRAYKPRCIKISVGIIICVWLGRVNKDIIEIGLDFQLENLVRILVHHRVDMNLRHNGAESAQMLYCGHLHRCHQRSRLCLPPKQCRYPTWWPTCFSLTKPYNLITLPKEVVSILAVCLDHVNESFSLRWNFLKTGAMHAFCDHHCSQIITVVLVCRWNIAHLITLNGSLGG
jgi:hypothetical protein